MELDVNNLEVVDNKALQQYEIRVGDAVALLAYEREGNRITFQHTDTPAELQGRGIAGRLAQTALDEARAAGLKVVPVCPYVAGYITRHPEYEDITIRDA